MNQYVTNPPNALCRFTCVLSLWPVLAMLVCLCGCTPVDRESALRALNQTNSMRLASLYFDYQTLHDWTGPKDEADFKAFIDSLPTEKLEVMGIDPTNVDSVFLSDRDEKPFKIRYGLKGSFADSAPVIFETQGIDGERQVTFTGCQQQLVESDAQYDRLWTIQPSNRTEYRNQPEIKPHR